MSMNCIVYAVSAELADNLRHVPEAVFDLLSAPNVNIAGIWFDFHCVFASKDLNHPPPHGFLVVGGEEIEGTDGGYGPARLFPPREVKDILAVVVAADEETFIKRFDQQTISQPALRDLYLRLFEELRLFVKATSERGDSLLVSLM